MAEIITQEILKKINLIMEYKPVKADCQEESSSSSTSNRNISNQTKSLISMEDIKHMKSGTLEIEKNTIITPLAMDHIKDKGINIRYKNNIRGEIYDSRESCGNGCMYSKG